MNSTGTKHVFENGKCKYCGCSEKSVNTIDGVNHKLAYETAAKALDNPELYAAAPEMLELMKRLIAGSESFVHDDDIRDLIDKAEGKTNETN